MRSPGMIRRSFRKWFHATFRLDARSLAVFRMAIGCILCCDALLRTRDFGLMFAADGLFPIGLVRGCQNDPATWSLCYLSDSLAWQGAVLAAEGAAGLAVALGLFTRASCLVAWAASVSVIRRTFPATNAGDPWLTLLLFWGIFLPLGRAWSLDAARAGRAGRMGRETVLAVPLVLQIAAVYFAAGLGKWNVSWLSGEAVSHALSVHDHGTPLGERLAGIPFIPSLLTWTVLALEFVGPLLLLAVPLPAVRIGLVAAFVAFHAGVACLMSVGLFAFIGAAAWMAIVPGSVWDRLVGGTSPETGQPIPPAMAASTAWLQAFFGVIATVLWLHAVGPWKSLQLPYPITCVANLACISQHWNMFGDVPGQRQWVYGRAELADGREVDLLRDGRPLAPSASEYSPPHGGFFSLPHHRWQKIYWDLHRPSVRVFSPSIAAALVRDWNARHGQSEQVRWLEIRFARLPNDQKSPTFHEILLASWPDRDDRGRGNLERFLESRE